MNLKQQLITTTTILFLSGGAAVASDSEEIAFAREAATCLAAVNDRADYDKATRVRHNVVELKNTFSGYVLAIDTRVYADSDRIAVREYSSHCIAKGDKEPSKFRFREISSG